MHIVIFLALIRW